MEHRFGETSHKTNSRGIGLVDMAYAITQGRAARASGEMALHSLELMHGMLDSAKNGVFHTLHSNFQRPAALPVNFPDNEA